jgi:hypothetical protein
MSVHFGWDKTQLISPALKAKKKKKKKTQQKYMENSLARLVSFFLEKY